MNLTYYLSLFSIHAEGVAQIETGILLQTFNVKKGAKAPEYNEYHHINPWAKARGYGTG